MRKILNLIIVIFVFSNISIAQNKFVIYGKINVNNNKAHGVKIEVYHNDNHIKTFSAKKSGKFEVKLSLNKNFYLHFKKNNYITKIVNVNTELPSNISDNDSEFPPFKFETTLYRKNDQIDLTLYEDPIAIISYDSNYDDFYLDDDYDKIVKPKIAKIETELKEKEDSRDKQKLLFDNYVIQANNNRNLKKYDTALKFYNKALKLNFETNKIEAFLVQTKKEKLIFEKEQLRNKQRADQLRRDKLKLENYTVNFKKGVKLFKLKRYDDASKFFRMSLTYRNNDKRANSYLRKIKLLNQKNELNKSNIALANKTKIADNSKYKKKYIKKEDTYTNKKLNKKNNSQIAKSKIKTKVISKPLYTQRFEKKEEAITYTKIKSEETIRQKYLKIYWNNICDNFVKLAKEAFRKREYVVARVYYKKALYIFPEREDIKNQIQLCWDKFWDLRFIEIKKEYDDFIKIADNAFLKKEYTVARFYYKKALNYQFKDRYPQDKINEIKEIFKQKRNKRETESVLHARNKIK